MMNATIHYKHKKWFTRSSLFLSILFITGCSSFQLLYGQLDRAVVWKVTDYIDLNGEDRDWLKAKINEAKQVFEEKQLQPIIALLQDASVAVEKPLNQEMLNSFIARSENLQNQFVTDLLPTTAQFFQKLDSDQLLQLAEALNESNKKRWEDYAGLSLAEQREIWRDKLQEGLEDWVGDLQPKQISEIAQLSQQVNPLSKTHQDFRIKWQDAFLLTINTSQQSDMFVDELALLFLQPEQLHDDAHKKTVQQRRRQFIDFSITFINGLSAEQRDKAISRLNKYQQDLQEIYDDRK